MHSSSLVSWDEIDINENNFRSISPNYRSHGIGAYGQDSMMNINSFRGSSERIASYGYHYSNGGSVTASSSQVTALGSHPSIFWDARSYNYGSASSTGNFTNQNNSTFYSIWRLADGSDVIADVAGGNNGNLIAPNRDANWDDQIFSVNGQEMDNTTNGTPLTKMVVSTNYADFSTSRPLLMSLTGGLSRGVGDTFNKNQPVDTYHRAGNQDYYLYYYPKYDGTSRKLLAKDDGLDWYGLQSRTQIDGSQPSAVVSANALSHASGYSRVGDYYIYEADSISNNSKLIKVFSISYW